MSPKGGIRPHKRFSIQANRSEVLFVDYIAEHLNPEGRAGVIVPEGIIFQSGNAYKALRKMLVDNYLFCVISLPAGVFNPYSGVKTSILFMNKTLAKQTDKVLFVKIENDGFDLGAQRREIAGNDFPLALTNVNNFVQSVRNNKEFFIPESPDILLVSKSQLAENGDYNLSAERYKDDDKVINISCWPKKTIGETCVLSTGGTPKSDIKEYYSNGNIRWLVSGDIHKGEIYDCENHITQEGLQNSNAKYLPINSVLIALNGQGKTRGTVALLRTDATCNQSIVAINPRDPAEIIPEFLYYQLRARYQEIRNLTGDTERSGLNMPIIRNLKIIVPPLNIQQEIVTEIESYQKIIDGARQVVSNYKPRIKIDPEWPIKPLGEVITLHRGYDLPKTQFIDGKVPVVGSNGIIGYHNENKEKGPGVVTGRSGTIGKVHYIDYDYYWPHNTALFVKDFNGNDRKFIKFLLESLDLKSLGDNVSAVPSLDRKNAHRIKVSVPPVSVQKDVVVQIEKEQKLVDANKQLIQIYEQKIKDKIAEVWEA
jgi:type I restriction enzyme M protein